MNDPLTSNPSNDWDVTILMSEYERLLDAEAERDRLREANSNLVSACARYVSALEAVATPVRPDGTYNRDRRACELLARKALNGFTQTGSPITDLTQERADDETSGEQV